MTRGLDPAADPIAIVDDLKTNGFKIILAVNIQNEYKKDLTNEKKTIKTQIKFRFFLPIFENSESIDKINNIRTIVFQVVKIEAIFKNTNRIVHYKNCQGYNYVRSSCHKRVYCVKCAGEHFSKVCFKPKDSKLTCASCKEAHTANYRGIALRKNCKNVKMKPMEKG